MGTLDSKDARQNEFHEPDDSDDASTLAGILQASTEACWCMEFTEPVNLNTSRHEIIRQIFENGPYWRFCNQAMARLYRLPPDQNFNHRQVNEIFPRNEKNEDFIRHLIKNDFHVNEVPALDTRYDKVDIYVENDVRAHIRGGLLIRMFGMVRNVGKQQRRENELREQIALLKGVLAAIPNPILAVTQHGSIVAANAAASDFYKRPLDRILGHSIYSLWHEPKLLIEQIADCLNNQYASPSIFQKNTPADVSSYTTTRVLIGPNKDLVLIQLHNAYAPEPQRGNTDRKQKSFGLLAETEIRPDFEIQRTLSQDFDRMLLRGERSISQGVRILITGESGVGKTELARHFHRFVADARDTFMPVNCASIPENLFESELFGYGRGAFTGADSKGRKGLIEQAEGGTLFLDEVGEIPLTVQAKLLSFLEDGVVQPVGGVRRNVSVRVITATNRNLYQMVSEGTFRADLYYRLAVVELHILPLREMPELITYLTESFVERVNLRRTTPLVIPDWVLQRIRAHSFPGNIRELFNVIQQLSIFCDDTEDLPGILEDILPTNANLPAKTPPLPAVDQPAAAALESQPPAGLKAQVRQLERQIIENAIRLHGSKRKAARALGVDIGTIVRKTADTAQT